MNSDLAKPLATYSASSLANFNHSRKVRFFRLDFLHREGRFSPGETLIDFRPIQIRTRQNLPEMPLQAQHIGLAVVRAFRAKLGCNAFVGLITNKLSLLLRFASHLEEGFPAYNVSMKTGHHVVYSQIWRSSLP
jgi:hypothetical protein